jgi:O-antigen ligase
MPTLGRTGLANGSHRARSAPAVKVAAVWLGVAALALLSGAFAAGQADAWLGKKAALLLMAFLAGATLLVLFAFLGSVPLLIWPVAATGGFLLRFPQGHPVLTFDRAWIGALLAFIALKPRRHERTGTTRLLLFALLLLVVAYGARAFAMNAGIQGPVATWVDAILLPTILFVVCERYCLSGGIRFRRLTAALMIAGGVLAAIGIAERTVGFELASLTGGSVRFDSAIDQTRISGPYPAPEPYALSLVVCLAATLYWIQSRKPGSGYRWALVLAAMEMGAIGLTLFRAAWIAAIVVIIASVGIRPGRIGRMYGVIGVAVAIAFAGTTQLQQNKTFSSRLNNIDNVYARLATYKQAFVIFRSSPVFGVGVNEYNTVASARRPEVVSGLVSLPYPHSSYLGLLAEQGIVGLLPFLLLSYAVWRLVRALRAMSFSNADAALLTGVLAGAAFGYLIMSLTLTMLPYEPSNTFFAALLGAGSGQLDALSGRTHRDS